MLIHAMLSFESEPSELVDQVYLTADANVLRVTKQQHHSILITYKQKISCDRRTS